MYNVPAQSKQPRGMTGFSIVWFGQLVSLLGTSMSGFGLMIWAWQVTGKATPLALMGVFMAAPSLLVSPFAGALVDRWNRKLVMAISDFAAGLSTIAIFVLYLTNNLQIWHLYAAGAFASVFQSFQWPAFSAAISTMLPKEQYARAAGMMSIAQALSTIAAPPMAGVLLVWIGLQGILMIDIVTFVFAVVMILLVAIPQPKTSAAGAQSKGSLLSEAGFGFRYIVARPSLLGLQLMFFTINFLNAFQFALLAPMILARTNSSSTILGTVQSAFGIGGLLGGILLSVWGGPKRKVHGVLIGMMLGSFASGVLMGLGGGVVMWSVAAFLSMLILPILNGSNQAIWQAKVPPDIQGKVFSVRIMIAQISSPLAMALIGPLADRIFEPRMAVGGSWSGIFGGMIQPGVGAGIALIMVLSGIIGMGAPLIGYMIPAIRNAEDLIPDHTDHGEAEHEQAQLHHAVEV